MQYAQIAVDTKTSLHRQTFTYLIPPQLLPDIKLGVLVLVSFHGRRIQGVIVELKQYSNKVIEQKLKPIIKIIDQNPVLDQIRLELAKWMSDYYLTPIGKVIFTMIPPTAMRQIKNTEPQEISKLDNIHLTQKKAIAFFCVNKNDKKKYNIYTLYNRFDERIADYLKLIDKSIQKNKKCLILFPNIEQAKAFQDLLPNSQLSSNNIFSKKNIKSVLYHSEMTKTQRYNIWADIRNNKHQVVIGTRPTVFAPINNLGLVVIDQGENFGYKEDQSSRYLSVTVAKKLCELTGANLVFGSLVPNVEGYYYEQHKKYLRLQNKPLESKKLISKRIIDLNTQKNKMISWELEESINKTIENNGKVLLFSQRKGEGSSFICQDCGHVFKCDRCSLPYTQVTSVQSQGIRLKCFRCNVKILVPKSCPNCRGIKLKSIGLGIDRIRDVIYKLFPNVKSIQIDVDSENIEQKIDSNQIIIATKKILDYNLKFNLVGIVNLDNLLNLPDYKTSENIYFTVVKLMYMTSKNFILQTFNPENKLWYFIRQSCPNVFLKDELLVRKDNNFPPFSQLIKLTYQNEFEEKCQKETEITKLQVTSYKLQVLWPGPSFIAKVRGRFQYQMIVFIKLKLEKELLKKIVSKLAKGWKIDVDPISLI